jgi:hypothetical protein
VSASMSKNWRTAAYTNVVSFFSFKLTTLKSVEKSTYYATSSLRMSTDI